MEVRYCALNPEDPLSTDHWLSSIGLGSLALGVRTPAGANGKGIDPVNPKRLDVEDKPKPIHETIVAPLIPTVTNMMTWMRIRLNGLQPQFAGFPDELGNYFYRFDDGGVNGDKNGVNESRIPRIKAEDLTMTETVRNHAKDIISKGVNKGEISRPYVESNGTNLLIQEIMDSGIPIKDASLPNGLRWDVPGSFNGRGKGTWELVIDLDTNKIVHFNFVK